MALTVSRLFPPTQLTQSAVTLYTCPASPTTSTLKNGRMRFTNTTAAAVTVTAYAVPAGGTPSATNEFLFQESISGNSHLDVDIPMLAAGDTLQALASALNAVSVFATDGVVFA